MRPVLSIVIDTGNKRPVGDGKYSFYIMYRHLSKPIYGPNVHIKDYNYLFVSVWIMKPKSIITSAPRTLIFPFFPYDEI